MVCLQISAQVFASQISFDNSQFVLDNYLHFNAHIMSNKKDCLRFASSEVSSSSLCILTVDKVWASPNPNRCMSATRGGSCKPKPCNLEIRKP